MKKSVTINIPEPCHEGWQNMTPTQKGRFCSSCEKEVVDFSSKNDDEVVQELTGKTNVCGRFKKSQLDRELRLERKSSTSFLPYAASLLLPISLMGSASSPDLSMDKKFTSLGIGRYSTAAEDRYQITTSGKITDANGKPIFNVEIIAKESGKTEVSGMRGDYEIKSMDRETLIIKKDGFVSQEIKLSGNSEIRNITLHPAINEMIDVMVLGGIRPIDKGDLTPKKQNKIQNSGENTGNATIIEIEEINEEVVEGEIIQEELSEKTTDENEKSITRIARGTVTDETGLPLPGANILIKATNKGTQTNFDGIYEIEVDEEQVLVFSYLGYETREINANQLFNIKSVVLLESATLGEVVVVGLIAAPESNAPSTKPFSDITFNHDPERAAWKRKLKKAHNNEVEFKRIKKARKKAARKLKRGKRTKQ